MGGFWLQDYGEVPKYLQQRNQEQQRAQEDFENFVKEHREQGALTNLSEDRRQAVLEVSHSLEISGTAAFPIFKELNVRYGSNKDALCLCPGSEEDLGSAAP